MTWLVISYVLQAIDARKVKGGHSVHRNLGLHHCLQRALQKRSAGVLQWPLP